jgi:hypothetical protein
MSSQEPAIENSDFKRKSETESICKHCSQTVRTDRYTALAVAEDIHADVCLVKAQSAMLYAFW